MHLFDVSHPTVYVVSHPIHLLSYLPSIILEWEMFQTKDVQKIETHILCSIIPPPKIVPFMR